MDSDLDQENSFDVNFKNRRYLLIKGSLGVLGLTMFPGQLIKASVDPNPLLQPLLLRFLGSFATNVGFGLVTNYVYDYLKTYFGNKSEPVSQYNRTRNWGYSYQPQWGFYGSRRYYSGGNNKGLESGKGSPIVHASLNGETNAAGGYYSYLFFPWLMSDRLNGLASFMNLVQGGFFTGSLSAPTVLGLTQASIDLLSAGIVRSQHEVSRALLPYCQDDMSLGVFQSSYRAPDSYCSDAGKVKVNYQALGRGKGQVRVTYRKNMLTGQKTVFDNAYGVDYA